MFTPEELKPGAKRAVLEYLAENGIPTARIYSPEEAVEIGPKADLIVRADGACQWDGFSGVFGSYMTRGNKQQIRSPKKLEAYHKPSELTLRQLIAIAGLEDSFESGSDEMDGIIRYNVGMIRGHVGWYCDRLGLPRPEKPRVLIQDAHSESKAMFQHPNNPNLVVIGINERTVLYDRAAEQFTYLATHHEWIDNFFDRMPSVGAGGGEFGDLRKAIKIHDAAASLPKFVDMGMTFEMEFGWHRNEGTPVVYQFKPFRKAEQAGFRLPPESGKNIVNFDLPVGITASSEGIKLKFREMYGEGSYSGSAVLVFPVATLESNFPPHVEMPDISALFIPIFDYRRDHGIREAVMKTPLALCSISELNEATLGHKDGIRVNENDFELPNIRTQGLELAKKIREMLNDGQNLRIYSDGITGRVVIE